MIVRLDPRDHRQGRQSQAAVAAKEARGVSLLRFEDEGRGRLRVADSRSASPGAVVGVRRRVESVSKAGKRNVRTRVSYYQCHSVR